ncbi:MAG: hypothetical protein IPP97_15890 [Candidatus Obscuribacter sp.]|nr:hypothetical protein [Candidatus Obscuribacter sp.]MBL0187213.1 hypothetical protein [Candidatus Obscuribacter sp.]MBP6350560.1 hypothetical protein [Candidatus Obscuribacter sp.]MBP7576429.1 hypothetical protein [Candidatus Obscuribacter sp.]
MTQYTSSQIGDLLSAAGLVTSESVDGALVMARTKKLPLGKILIDSGLLTELELSGCLQAQSLIREKLLAQELACSVLYQVRENGRSFVENLRQYDHKIESINFALVLGQLFMDAGALDQEQFDEAMETSIVSGLPLVRVLVLQQSLDEKSAYAGLTAQLMVKERKVGRDQAVGALKLSHMHGDQLEEILEFGGFKKYRSTNFVRLGELLVLSEMIGELDLLSCVERSMSDAKPLGQVLVDEGIMDEQTVQSALRAQKYIEAGTIDALRASQMLKHCADTGQLLEFSVEELASIKPQPLTTKPNTFAELLSVMGLVSADGVEQIRLVEIEKPDTLEEFILKNNYLSIDALNAILAGWLMIEDDKISTEQLIFAIHVWLWTRGDFKKTLNMLGW